MIPLDSPRPGMAVAVSVVAALLIILTRRRPALRDTIMVLAALIKAGVVLSMLGDSSMVHETTWFALPGGLALHLRADRLGLFFACVSSLLWIATAFYAVGYMRGNRQEHQTGFFAAFALSLAAAVGIAFSANLLTFFVFFEMLTLSTYPLVVHKRSAEALRAGRQYLAYTLISAQILLLAVIWAQTLVPGAQFQPGGFLQGAASGPALALLFAMFIVGVGVKAALMPLHAWLPAAMIAPTPVSALLHAVAVVKAGVFGVLRVSGFVFGMDLLKDLHLDLFLCVAASVTILAASLRALKETQLKKRLAYSTVSQLSYIVLGVGLGSVAALAAAVFHVAAHAVMKITLFFCAGSIYTATHKENISELTGIGRTMPITMAAFAAGSLGLIGIPLFAGFLTKWNLGLGAIAAGRPGIIAVLIASAVLNAAYFLPIVRNAFAFSDDALGFKEPSAFIWVPLAVTAALSMALGLFPDLAIGLFDLSWQVAREILGEAAP